MMPDELESELSRSVSVIDVDALALIACERFDMLQRFHWLIVPIGCYSCRVQRRKAMNRLRRLILANWQRTGHGAAATQPPPPTATPEGPLVTTSEPQSVEIGVEILPSAIETVNPPPRQKNRKFRRTNQPFARLRNKRASPGYRRVICDV